MLNTNVKLSKDELALVNNSHIILTKNRIIEKVIELFGAIYEEYKTIIRAHGLFIPQEVLKTHGKISKGERYENLPYIMLDYPRHFTGNNIFAIRSFFWWGNFFSITLHLSGEFAKQYPQLLYHPSLQSNEWFVCVNEDEWQHHFREENFLSLSTCIKNHQQFEKIKQQPFIKLAKKIPLEKWSSAISFYKENFKEMLEILKP